ncbi:MAG: hypothetical protein H7Y36_01545 [Armatimonadetes bacterium]|nr:hypothetical protein [Akkermansiaceae bacterium]
MKSLIWVCSALQSRRAEKKGGNALHPSTSSIFTPEIQRLLDEEDFETLSRAKNALENGYFSFLTNLCLICFWLFHEAENPSHVIDQTKKQIRDIESEHKRKIRKLDDELAICFSEKEHQEMQKGWEESEKFRKEWKEERGISHRVRNTRDDTDLPTLGMIQEMHRELFPGQRKFWKHYPKDISAIWRDAGLSWLPQDRGGKHPFLPERIDTLKAFLRTLSDH